VTAQAIQDSRMDAGHSSRVPQKPKKIIQVHTET